MRWIAALALLVALAPSGASAEGRTGVVFIGGLGSEIDSANWGLLAADLQGAGFTTQDFYSFSYDGWSVPAGGPGMIVNSYQPGETCAPLDKRLDLLAGMLRFVRDNQWATHVVLVGHSLGGVVAFDVAARYPDLVPFISRVVTLDSPLGGISAIERFVAVAQNGSCQSVFDLR